MGGIAAALLPVRYWSTLEAHVPVASSAIPSALLTFMAGGVVGSAGFLRYAAEVASINNKLMLDVANTEAGGRITTAAPVALTSIALLTFVIATPLGWA